MRKFFAIIHLAVISLLLPAASTVDAKVPDVVSEQKNAVVTVYVQDKNGNHIFEAGGFIVDQNGVVVTSCRAIAKWFAAVENVLHVETGEGLDFPIEDLISSRCDNNLALFRVKQTGLPAVRIAPEYELRKGKEIFIIGRSSGSGIDISEGTLKDVYEKDRVAQITVPVTPEMSGSPVFNVKGEAVGAAISLTKKGKSLNVSVSLKGVAKQLARYRKLAKIETPAAISAPGKKPAAERVEKHLEPKKKADKGEDAANAYFQRGCGYQELNMHKEAVKEYQQSVKIKPILQKLMPILDWHTTNSANTLMPSMHIIKP